MAERQTNHKPLNCAGATRHPWISIPLVLAIAAPFGVVQFGTFCVSGFIATAQHTSLPRHPIAETIWQVAGSPAFQVRGFLFKFGISAEFGLAVYMLNSLAWGVAAGILVSLITKPRGSKGGFRRSSDD